MKAMEASMLATGKALLCCDSRQSEQQKLKLRTLSHTRFSKGFIFYDLVGNTWKLGTVSQEYGLRLMFYFFHLGGCMCGSV